MSVDDYSKSALKISVLYFLIGFAWIIITDYEAYIYSANQINLLSNIQTHKGLGFIFLTTLVVYFLSRYALRKQVGEIESRLENERRLESLTRNTMAGIYEIDRNKNRVFINERFSTLTGITDSSDIHKDLEKIVFEDDRKTIMQKWNNAMELNTPIHEEYRLVDKNGNITWVMEDGHTWHDAGGQFHGYTGTLLDISKHKKLEQSLWMNNFAVEKTGDAIFWIKSDGSFYFVNKAACSSLGYSRDELLDMSIFDVDPDFNRDDWSAAWRKLQETGSITLESRHRARGGDIFPIEVRAYFTEIDGEYFNCAVVRDISERMKTERALKETRNRLEHLLNATPTVMYATKILEHKIQPVWASSSIERILGYTVKEALEPGWWSDNIHENDRQQCIARMQTLMEKDSLTHTYRFYHKSGSILWIRDELRILRNEEGEPGEVIGAWNNITEQVETENKLRQMQKLDAIGKLSSGIAHDFNNRLTVIIGNLQLLERQLADDSNLHPLINSAIEAAKTGATLTQRLLAFSRQQVLETEILNINKLIKDINTLFRNTLGEIITTDLRLQEELWMVNIDAGQLEEAMLNLCVNARDAMPNGGKLVIETSNFTFDDDIVKESYKVNAGDYVRLSISDNGLGMSSEIQRRVFEPFYTTKKSMGNANTGLGLPMVYGFVKQSGGYISIYSEQDHGTSVNIYLPRVIGKKESESARHPRETGQEYKTLINAIKGSTALVVEDDELVRNISVLLLKELGFQVIEAENADHGLQIMAKGEQIDLVFTDMMMPGGMNGVEMVNEMRKSNPSIKAIVVSGYSEDTTINTRKMNIVWLKKPFTRNSLMQKLQEVQNTGNEK